jgi:alpha-ketoglutarate-dependent taurine dioxygenase
VGELKIEKLTPTVGAEILDVDVERMLADDELPGLTLEALDAHGALVFRGLHVDDESQVAFSKRLGRVETFPGGPIPEIFRVTLDPAKNKAAAYLKGTFDWHIDGLTEDVPIMATLLAAHAVAESGGETEFASSYDAFEALSDEEKERALATRVVHSLSAAAELADAGEDMLAMAKHRPSKEHPLVWTHASGRRSLVLGATTDHVVGMDPEEGRAYLDDLLERSTQPDRVYRHEWEVGDLVIWDNRGVLHRALPYDPTSARDMHRTTLYGEEAIQ